MLLCCSHTGWRTAHEAIEVSRAPVILSHSNPHGLWPHPRNVPDELMLACARTGGVIGINGIGPFLGEGPASAKGIVRHIAYALSLVGEDHVSLALDYSFDRRDTLAYVRRLDEDSRRRLRLDRSLTMAPPETLPRVAELLLADGHPARVVAKVLGGNLMRLADDVWR